MNDVEVLDYLLSHAPLERFYVFSPGGSADAFLIKYFDASGKSWNIMEDNDEIVESAVAYLKRCGTKVLTSYPALHDYERENARK